MNKTTITIAAILISLASFALGHAMADPVQVKTVEKEVVVNPVFEFKVGDKAHCEIGTEVKPCEIIAQKSTGSYAVKYYHSGIAGGDKIIIMSPQSILR